MKAIANTSLGLLTIRLLTLSFLVAFLHSSLPAEPVAGERKAEKKAEEKVEKAEKTSTSRQEVSLDQIRNYQVNVAELRDISGNQTGPLSELVNPFPTQRKRSFFGSVYLFHRNNRWDARNFFDAIDAEKPPYRRNEFGFTFSKELGEKASFFASYEGLRVFRGSTLLSHVPTVAMKSGDFSAEGFAIQDPHTGEPFPDNRIPDERIHPVSRSLLKLYPDPNRDDASRNFVNNEPFLQSSGSLSLRLDYELSPASKLFAQYNFFEIDRTSVSSLPGFSSTRDDQGQSGSLSYSRTHSPHLLTSWEARFNRRVIRELSENAERQGLVASLGIEGIHAAGLDEEGFPDFVLSGYANFGDGNSPTNSANNYFSLDHNLTYVLENHTLRIGAGMDLRQLNDYRSGSMRRGRFAFNGAFSGDSFADFLLGAANSASRGVGSERADLRGKSLQVTLRDDWKLTPRLDLNLGMNYNFFQPFQSAQSNISVLHPLLLETPEDAEIVMMDSPRAVELGLGRAGPRGTVFPRYDNFAPRLGLAFRPLESRVLVIRSSYFMSNSPLSQGHYLGYLGRNYPFYFIEQAQAATDGAGLNLSAPFEDLIPTEQTIRGIEPGIRTAYVQRWTLALQNSPAQNWFLEASYGGRKGTHLPRALPGNIPLPGPGAIQPRRPNSEFGQVTILTGSGSSIEHSLGLEAERRLADGVSFKSGFSWTRQLNDMFRGNPGNPRDLRAERGSADFIPARRFFLNYIFDLPFGRGRRFAPETSWMQWLVDGWRLSGITNVRDGTPFTVGLSGDPNNDGLGGDRPMRTGPASLPPDQRSIDTWFVAGDFEEPPSYSFGNAGRNILSGPGYQNWDISLVKRTRVQDGNLLELRVELFNAFNQVNFNDPGRMYGTSLFGQISGASRSREIEVAVKYSF